MTQEQALSRAKALWGDLGKVYDRNIDPAICWGSLPRFWVGAPPPDHVLLIENDLPRDFPFGNGDTWEAAFANAGWVPPHHFTPMRNDGGCSLCTSGEFDAPHIVDETPEQERRRVFGACGGKCGEKPCIEWNAENDRRTARRANALIKSLEPKPTPDIPTPQAPLYMTALNAFWKAVEASHPDADKVTLPADTASAFEAAAAAVVEDWIALFNTGGFNQQSYE